MHQTFENKTCDTILRLKEEVIKQKNKEVETWKNNYELEKGQVDFQRKAIESLQDYAMDREIQFIKMEKKKEVFRVGFLVVSGIAIIESIIIFAK